MTNARKTLKAPPREPAPMVELIGWPEMLLWTVFIMIGGTATLLLLPSVGG